ncbi:hypothetical protein C8Q77DRAFT_1072988 [Trametes polyzona]|nr:hypothetical protein C8Q77DRAFT_1072988 [Trametes polyzona]
MPAWCPYPWTTCTGVCPARRNRTNSWLVVFKNTIATAYHAISFLVASASPLDFPCEPDNMQVREVKVGAKRRPSGAGYIQSTPEQGCSYEPAVRLLVSRPAELTAHALIGKMHAVFKGATAPPEASFLSHHAGRNDTASVGLGYYNQW